MMVIGGLDIATTSGLAIARGETITASSFRPRAKRPFELGKGEVDFAHEGAVAREFRDHLRAWLMAEGVQAVGIERPLQSNVSFRKPVVNMNAGFAGQAITYEERGGTTFNVIFRLYMLVGIACETCSRLNIPVHVVNQSTWRKAFFGDLRPPRGSDNKSAWWKEQAKLQCGRLGIEVKGADAAEACGVVFWLRGQMNPRTAARPGDLFREHALPQPQREPA